MIFIKEILLEKFQNDCISIGQYSVRLQDNVKFYLQSLYIHVDVLNPNHVIL